MNLWPEETGHIHISSLFLGNSVTFCSSPFTQTWSVATSIHTVHCIASVFGTIGQACICMWRGCAPHAQGARSQTLPSLNPVSWCTTSPSKPHSSSCTWTLIWLVRILVSKGPRLTLLLVVGCAPLAHLNPSPVPMQPCLLPLSWKYSSDIDSATPLSLKKTQSSLVYAVKPLIC